MSQQIAYVCYSILNALLGLLPQRRDPHVSGIDVTSAN